MDDLIGEFIAETKESINELDTEIINLEQRPDDYELINSIFRLMHTIKGTCGFLGLSRLEKVAHSGENVLDKLRNKELNVTSEAVDFILESIDQIKKTLEALGETGKEPEGDDSALIAKLDAFANGEEAPAPDATSQPAKPDLTPITTAKTNSQDEAKNVAVDEGLKIEADEATTEITKTTSTPTIRVGIDVLENLMQLVSELVLTRNQLMQEVRKNPEIAADFTAGLQRLNHITSDLQEGVMQTRMQPIGIAWNKLPRIIRDLSQELGKKIDLKMIGEDTELDRQLLELVRDPLTHMVRNSADHGIETPDERAAAGKPETGTITLSAFHEGGHIIIEIKDDGKGIDPEIIKNIAIEKGLVSAEDAEKLDDRQIYRFIFAAGFSTATSVTSVSGRGVGMDVVRSNISKIGGSVDLDSIKNEGTTFQMKIPLTLAIMPVLIMEVAGEKFAIPQINVVELVSTSGDSDHRIEKLNESPVLNLRGRLLPLIDLGDSLGISEKYTKESKPQTLDEDGQLIKPTIQDLQPKKSAHKQFTIICEIGAMTFGLIVDKVFDTEEIVVKPVSKALRNILLYSGSTILGDGSIIMILDPNGLANSADVKASKSTKTIEEKIREEDKPVSFLAFKSGDGSPKAVPLELVSRLEQVKLTDIENAGDLDVVQYRSGLMRIAKLNTNFDYKKPANKQDNLNIIVFNDGEKTLGLAAESIIDIIEQKIKTSLDCKQGDYLGSMVINEKATDIVDVSKLFDDYFSDWKTKDKIAIQEEDNKRLKDKILLVEDSPFFTKLMLPILTSRGYIVNTATNGLEAARMLSREPDHDIIITDIEMPEMNGFEFAEACLSDANIKHIPIIALTSTEDSVNIERAKDIGISYYVNKSDRDRLFDAVHHLLKSKEIA